MNEIWNIAGAILVALGGGGAIVLLMSSWLGKVWANRILESEKAKFQTEFALLKSDLDKKIHEHNVAVTRVDAQRVKAIQNLYGALVGWHEAVIEIFAPNKLHEKSVAEAIETYRIWANALRNQSEALEKLAMISAIYLSEDTYTLVARCGFTASVMSIEFSSAVYEYQTTDANAHLRLIETIRKKLQADYKTSFEPARIAVIREFRSIIDPRIPVGN